MSTPLSSDLLDAEVLRHVQETRQEAEKEQRLLVPSVSTVLPEQPPMMVAVDNQQVHAIQQAKSHILVSSQNELQGGNDHDAELATQKMKKQKKSQTPKKTNGVDANGNPIDKRKSAALQLAHDIVQRFRDRGNVLPKEWIQRKGNPEREREYRDKNKLRKWRQSLHGNYKGNICFEEIKQYLDLHMPNWSQGRQSKFRPTVEAAQGIIERYYARGSVLPRVQHAVTADSTSLDATGPSTSSSSLMQHEHSQQIPETATFVDSGDSQETHDAECLSRWRQQYIRNSARKKKSDNQDILCDAAFDSVKELLDQHIPNWHESYVEYGDPNASMKSPRPRQNVDPMQKATEIVRRYKERGNVLPKEWNDLKGNPERMQEYKDASKLRKWRQALNGLKSVSTVCPDFLQEYLDQELVNWRYSVKNKVGSRSSSGGEEEGGADKRFQRKRKRLTKEEENEIHNQSHDHTSHELLVQPHTSMNNGDGNSATYAATEVMLAPNSEGLQMLHEEHHQHQQASHLLDEHRHVGSVTGVVGLSVEQQQQLQHHHLQQHLHEQARRHHHQDQTQQHHLQQAQQHHLHQEQQLQQHEQQEHDNEEQDHDMAQLVQGLTSEIGDTLPSSPSLLTDTDSMMTISRSGEHKADHLVYDPTGHSSHHDTDVTGSSLSDGNIVGSAKGTKRARDTYEVTETVQI